MSDGPGGRPPFPPPAGPSGTPPIQQMAVEPGSDTRPNVRATLAGVITMQVVALVLLWVLQAHYTR